MASTLWMRVVKLVLHIGHVVVTSAHWTTHMKQKQSAPKSQRINQYIQYS